jgi:hypothetical protein
MKTAMAQSAEDAPGRTATYESGTLTWWKSSFSIGNGNCLETARTPDGGHLAVRDSKDKSGPVLTFTPGEWRAFVAGVKNGEFDCF